MNDIDLIKRLIYEDTVTRDTVFDNTATQQYYQDLLEALSIQNFPLIEVNTISKKTYMLENKSNTQCYLIFDHYLMDNIHLLNQIALRDGESKQLEAYFFKTMAEECYTNNKYALSINYAGSYLNVIDEVV